MSKEYNIKTKTKKGKKYTAEEVEELIIKAFLEGINNGEEVKKKIKEILKEKENKTIEKSWTEQIEGASRLFFNTNIGRRRIHFGDL